MATDAEMKKIAHETATKMREFHQEDLTVMREYMDGQFESIDRRFESMQSYMDGRFDAVNERFDSVEERIGALETQMAQVTLALQNLLDEFKKHREEVDILKKTIADLQARLEVLEAAVLKNQDSTVT